MHAKFKDDYQFNVSGFPEADRLSMKPDGFAPFDIAQNQSDLGADTLDGTAYAALSNTFLFLNNKTIMETSS